MKKVFSSIKEEFKKAVEFIKENSKKNEDKYTSFMIFFFYFFLTIAAGMCLFTALYKLGFIYILGVYFSIRILVNFVKDFTGLIHKYIVDKHSKEEDKEDSGE